MNDAWFSPSEIKYSRGQCIWIIEHLEGADSWPPDFKVTGYSGKSKGGINKRAYFDNVKVIYAEVKRRLKLTKTDGKLLKAQIQGGITEYEELEPEAQMALNYISLFDFRKRPSYYQWKKRRRYYYSKEKIARKYPKQRLNHIVGSSISTSLRGKKEGRHWESLVNFSLNQLMNHLESKFQDGMNWDNYGKWHIDHIIPKSNFRFDSIDDEAFKKCWSLANLQPLWGPENCSKGKKLDTKRYRND